MKFSSILVLSLSFCVFACGGTVVETPTTPALEVTVPAAAALGALDYMSTDVFAVITVDVSRGLESPFFPLVRDALYQTVEANPREGITRANVDHMLGMLNDVQTVTLGLSGSRRDTAVLVFVESALSLTQVTEAFRLLDDGVVIERAQIGGNAALRLDNGEFLLVEVGPGRFLAGSAAQVQAAVTSPPVNSLAQSAEFMAAQRLLSPDVAIHFASVNPSTLDSDFDGITAAAITVDAPDGVHFRVHSRMDSPERAATIVQEIERARAQVLQQFGMMLTLGLDAVLRDAEIRADGSDVYGSLDMTEVQARAVLAMAMGMM